MANDPDGAGDAPDCATATDVAHLGRDPFAHHGFVNTPVYRGSTVLFPTYAELISRRQTYTYGRRGTPTTTALETALTALHGGVVTTLTSSGLAAVTTAILAFAPSGSHILMPDSVYQPARAFCDSALADLGVETSYYDPADAAAIASLIRDNTSVVFVESPGSQTFEVQDIPAIADAAHARGCTVIADNTWATALFCRPLALGADVVVEAATKYIIGHADGLLGFITGNARSQRKILAAREAFGTCSGSEETFLALRGLRTLDVRLQRHMTSAIEIAIWLEDRPEVHRVLHPALPSHAGHKLWQRDFNGASGLFTFILKEKSTTALAAFLDGLKLFGMGYSWGGYESLAVPFDPRTYRTATAWSESGHAVRLHIGLEAIEDLKRDLELGFERLRLTASGAT